MTPEERAKDFFSLPPLARTHAALARMIRQAENEKCDCVRLDHGLRLRKVSDEEVRESLKKALDQ